MNRHTSELHVRSRFLHSRRLSERLAAQTAINARPERNCEPFGGAIQRCPRQTGCASSLWSQFSHVAGGDAFVGMWIEIAREGLEHEPVAPVLVDDASANGFPPFGGNETAEERLCERPCPAIVVCGLKFCLSNRTGPVARC